MALLQRSLATLSDLCGRLHVCAQRTGTPFLRACLFGQTAMATILLDRGANICAKLDVSDAVACVSRAVLLLRQVSASRPSPALRTRKQDNAQCVLLAAENGHNSTVRMLLQRGADLNATGRVSVGPCCWWLARAHVPFSPPHSCTRLRRDACARAGAERHRCYAHGGHEGPRRHHQDAAGAGPGRQHARRERTTLSTYTACASGAVLADVERPRAPCCAQHKASPLGYAAQKGSVPSVTALLAHPGVMVDHSAPGVRASAPWLLRWRAAIARDDRAIF